MDYLTGRPQIVWLKDCLSDLVIFSTGVSQGTVLAPLLFHPIQFSVATKGECLQVVSNYKYMGVHLNEILDWSTNTEAVYKK